MKRVTIYQPQFFPRLHYFNRILNSDIFVILDSAQYTRVLNHEVGGKKVKHKSFQSQTQIKLPQGIYYLTVPVKNEGFLPINKTAIDYEQNWQYKHSQTIKQAYAKSTFYSKYLPQIEDINTEKYTNLADLNTKTILWGMTALLGIDTNIKDLTIAQVNKYLENQPKIRLKKITRDLDMIPKTKNKNLQGTEWIIKICQSIGANELYHGETSKVGYLDSRLLEREGIKSTIQNWKCADYPQLYSNQNGFIPNLSILDLIMNLGEVDSKKIILPN